MCLFVFLSFFVACQAAMAGPAYRRLVTSPPAEQSWKDGIDLSLETDVAACKKAYGESRWIAECQAPTPGRSGQRVEGIRMTPHCAGTWRWTSGTSMRFYPKQHLAPNTLYTISLEHVALPSRYALGRNILYKTAPQAVHIAHETLWIDPSSKGQHAITVPMTFIWPINREQFESSVRCVNASGDSSLRLGALRYVWNEDQDEVLVTIPLLSLPQKNIALTLSVQGIPSWHEERGRRVFGAMPQGKNVPVTSANLAVTGVDRVMDIKNIVVEPRYDKTLSRAYQVVVTTTLQTKPHDVLEHLDLLLLPKKSLKGASKDCDWENMPALSVADIQQSQKLQAQLAQPGDEPATEIRLNLTVPEGRGVLCAMKSGLRSLGGYTLNRVRRFIRNVPKLTPEVHFLQPGNILPLRPNQKLDVHSMAIDALGYEIAEVREPYLALMAQKTGFTFDEDVDLSQLSLIRSGRIDLPKQEKGKAQFTALDLKTLLGHEKIQSSLMLVQLTGLVGGEVCCQEKRLILLSDLGLLAKTQRDGSHAVFVQHFSNGKPAANVTVSLLGANGLPVVSAKTDKNGFARLPSTYGLSREKKPVALFAAENQHFAWLPFDDNATVVSYSDFPVAGRHAEDEGLIASVFTERGVYSPGETLHIGAIVRNHTWKPLGKNLPLTIRLFDPSGTTLVKEGFRIGDEGLGRFSWKSSGDSPTGTYRVDLCLEKGKEGYTVLGSVQTRIEEFEPDTLALGLSYVGTDPKGWIATKTASRIKVHLDTLYGEAAAGNRIRAKFVQEPRSLAFDAFHDYTFVDSESGETKETALPEAITDANGDCILTLPGEEYGGGSYVGRLYVEGFEKSGGRAVGKSVSYRFSPKTAVLGYKPEQDANNLSYIPEGSKAALRFLVLDPSLAPKRLEGVRIALSERRFVTSLVSDSQGRYRYDATPVDTELAQSVVTLEPKGTLWSMPTAKAGEYLVTLSDAKGELLGQIPFTVAGNRLASPGTEPVLHNGSLRLALDKEHYAPGDEVHFQIAAPFAGTGIVTIERDQVEAYAWFTAEPGVSVHAIRIPEDFEGRGYLNVSFVRAQSSNAIYMDPHAYAVAPFTVGIARRDMQLAIQAPDRVLPGSQVAITVSAKQPGRVQLFCVDEGILQLTNFADPNPLRDLIINRALDVETREAYHLLMPDHERLLGRIPGFGGGMGSTGGRFQNPFKRKSEPPFAFWSELLDVGSKPATVTVTVPAYFAGTFRIMAVGSGHGEKGLVAGSASAKAHVRGGVIVKPQLPLVLAPKDQFDGAFVVANTVSGSGSQASIQYTIDVPEALNLVSGKKQGTLMVPEGEERVLPLRFAVGDGLGVMALRFHATDTVSGKTTVREQSIAVRPANQKRRSERAVPLRALPAKGDVREWESDRLLYPFDAKTRLTLAEGPLLALRSLFDRLDGYPYGCTEQKISKAMPSVLVWDAPALRRVLFAKTKGEDDRITRGQKMVKEALAQIRASMRYDGVALWADFPESDPFITAYAGDFLICLQEHGLTPPQDLREQIMGFLEDMVGRTPQGVNDGRVKLYAAWVLVRDGRIMTSQLNTLEDWFKNNVRGWERDVLASLLAESYATLRMRKRAVTLMPQSIVTRTEDAYLSTTVARSLNALIQMPTSDATQRQEMLAAVQDAAFSPNTTTLDAAMASRALVAALRGGFGTMGQIRVSCAAYAPGFEGLFAEQTMDSLHVVDAPGCRRFVMTGADDGTLYAHLSEDGFDTKPEAPKKSDAIEVTKTLQDEAGNVVQKASLGDVVRARVCARTPGKYVRNVVLVDLVPGGLEPVLEKEQEESPEGLVRYERREDRGIFFVDLTPDERCFTYRLRATTRGDFVVPQAHGEAMYEPAFHGMSKQGRIVVE